MKYIIISIVIIVIILIIYTQFGNKTDALISTQETENIDTTNKKSTPHSGTLKKIDNNEYHRYILTKKTTENYILKMIKEYGELSGNEEFQIHSFQIAEYGDWQVIKVGDSVSFYVYHNLVGWLFGYDENPEAPELSIGFSKNKKDLNEDYVFYLDPNNIYGDTEIGVFNNGKNFFIYLPEAFEEYGNLTITNDIAISMEEKTDYLSQQGLDITKIISLTYTQHNIKMND